MSTELHWLTLTEVAAKIAAREVTSSEVTRAMLERVAALDPALHAYVAVLAERALAQASVADREIVAGRYRGPLHGVPIAVKDLCDLVGTPTTAGTTILRDRIATSTATVVERLEAAGAIILGKLMLTEGAMANHHPAVAAPVNPWSAQRWPGVSSSGSGVATAAGLCFGSLGSDTGGSIRFPSAACGIVGIKPTWGRVSRAGVFPLAASLDHIGPMTRSVADAAAMLGVIAGGDPRDPTALHAPVPDYAAAVGRGARGLRIGVDERYAADGMDAEVAGLVMATIEVLRQLGAEIVAVTVPPTEGLIAQWNATCAAEAAVGHKGLYPERAAEYGPALAAFLEAGRKLPATAYAAAHEARLGFSGELRAVFEDIDLLLTPTLGVPTPSLTLPSAPAAAAAVMRFTAPFDYSGSPTISVPCGFTADGMPASLQLVGRHLEEETLIAAGAAYEGATSWRQRRPPLAS